MATRPRQAGGRCGARSPDTQSPQITLFLAHTMHRGRRHPRHRVRVQVPQVLHSLRLLVAHAERRAAHEPPANSVHLDSACSPSAMLSPAEEGCPIAVLSPAGFVLVQILRRLPLAMPSYPWLSGRCSRGLESRGRS